MFELENSYTMLSLNGQVLKNLRLASHLFFRQFSAKSRNIKNCRAFTNPMTAAEEMNRSVCRILTIDRWESLNFMKYRTSSLRPVHGRLALKFSKWVVKQPGLELCHITHLYCITSHILIRARMYDSAKLIFKQLMDMGMGPSSVFWGLMDTYPLCNSNPAVFDLLIRVYVRKGASSEAIDIFRMMGLRGFRPSIFTCNMILSEMSNVQLFESVWLFFSEMVAGGICPNVRTFNILLNVLCVEGKLKKAGHLLRKMEENGYSPSVVSYNTVLNWYCKNGAYKEASELLDRMSCKGVEADVRTYNLLVDYFCKNKRSAKGYLLLRKMRKRMVLPNVVTYNTLIHGFFNEANLLVAEKVFDEMCKVGISPNCVTYNILIYGSCRAGMFSKAFEIVNEIKERGLVASEVTYGTILNGLCKNGELAYAKNLLERIESEGMCINSVMYTTLIDGMCGNGILTETVRVLDKMSTDHVYPDVITYSVLVNGFSRAGKINNVKEIICKMYKSGIKPNRVVYSTLICNLCRLGDVNGALKVFRVMKCPDIFVCNLLVSALCKSGNIGEAEVLLHYMSKNGITPNSITFDAIIGGYANLGDGLKAFELFDEMVKLGHQPSFYTYGNLLRGLCRGGNFNEALKFFDSLRRIPCCLDIVMYNTMLAEICKRGYFDLAFNLLDEMGRKNMVLDRFTQSSLISGLCRNGKVVSAVLLLETGTVSMDEYISSSIINGFVKTHQPQAGILFFDDMVSCGKNLDTVSFNAVIDACSRIGKVSKLNNILSMMRYKNVPPSLATYNILLHGEAKRGNISRCFELYHTILSEGLVPDKLTCHSLIIGMIKAGGMIDLAAKFLKMTIVVGIGVDHLTYNMMIKFCCERGYSLKAFDFLNAMKLNGVLPNEDTYGYLFNGLKRTSLRQSSAFLQEMLANGFTPTNRQCFRLFTSMCKSGDFQGAFKLIHDMGGLGVISHEESKSTIVRGLVQCGKTEEALLVLKCMLRDRLIPNVPTFTSVMHGLCKESKLDAALDVKLLMESYGAMLDVVAYNVLITGLCRIGRTDCSWELYKEMKCRGVWANTTTFEILVTAILDDDDSVRGAVMLKDLEARGLGSQNSKFGDWKSQLVDAMKKIYLFRSKSKRIDRRKG